MEKNDTKPWERPWTTDEIREHSANWNLAGDSGLLNHLQQFSQNLLAKTHATEVAVDKLVEDLKTTATSVENATNTFLFLANTQFVENRVYDDDEKETPPEEKKDDVKPPKTKEEQEAEVFQNVKKALDMGLALLDTHFEAVEVPASDSEEEESSASVGRLVLKPKNPYISRPLPYLIGSREFMEDDKVGLGEISSDTEDSPDQNIVQSSESDDEMEHDELTVAPKRPMTLASSDLENSEPESDRSEIVSKQKKLRTAGAFGEEVEQRDMFGQESPPEADEVSVVKGGMKSAFSDELSSKLGVVKSQNVSERENVKDNIFVPSSEPDDDGLFGKANNSFTDKQGLFDDIEDWQSTSDSLWKSDNVSSSKPSASKGHQSKETDIPKGVSDISDAHDQEDEVFTITKPKASAHTNISQKEKISSSTPQDIKAPKPQVDSLFGSTDEPEDLFNQNYKDTGSPAGKSALFGKDDMDDDDDLFAIPPSSSNSQSEPALNSNKKKKLPGAVPVFSGVNLFGDLSPIAQRGSTSGNNEGNSLPSGSGLQYQEPSSGLGSSVDGFKKEGESRSQECAVATSEKSSTLDSQKLFQNVVTSTKIEDVVPSKSSLFNTEIDSDSLFDKPKSADQRILSGSKIPASTSSSLKSKTKKTVSLFDDSDSGDDELLFSSTSSTSSRSRRSQGSGDVLGSGIERRTLPKKDLFDDNLLFGTLNKDEPDVDIFGSQTESKSGSRSFAKDNVVSGNDVMSDNLIGSKKVTSSIFDDIDEVDDIFAVPKVSSVETQKQASDKTQANLEKLSLFSDNLVETNDIFSNEVYENKKKEGIVPEVLEVPSHCDNVVPNISDSISVKMSGKTSLLPKDSSQIFGPENKSTPESQESAIGKNLKPSISQKPNVPKKSAPSSVLSQNNLNLGLKVDENNTSVSDTRTENVKKCSNFEANVRECDLSNDVHVEKVCDDQTPVSSVIKPDPPRTLNIRKTTDIVFRSPSNEEDDLFESAQTDKLIAEKESIHNEKLGNKTLSPNNFSKLLEGFNSSSANMASTGSASREQSSNDSEISSKNVDSSEVVDVRGPPKAISSPIKLLIDPRTLLPGAKPPSKMVSSDGTIGFDKPAETSTLHSAGKERVKIQVKRRPQTRKARQEALRASSIEYDNIDAALTSQVSNSKNDDVQNSLVSSSASSSSPVNNVTPKVFEPDGFRNTPVAEKNSSSLEKDPKLYSEGQSSVSESNHLPVKTDAFRSMLSDCLSGNSNALSPLTDEEDIFAVPHELPFDESSNKEMPIDSKNLFGGAPVLSPMDDKTVSENFSKSSLKLEGEKDIQTDLEDTINNEHMFDADPLGSDISSSIVVSDKNSNKTSPSIINTEEIDVNRSDSKWLGCDLERSTVNRGLFDDGGDEVESDDDDDDDNDLFSSIQKQRKSKSKAKKSTSKVTPQRPLFSPEVDLENTSKENLERKKSFSEEFHESLTQEISNVSSQPSITNDVSRDDKLVNDQNPLHLPMTSENFEPNKNDDLFATNENSKEIKVGCSVKISEKNISHEKAKSHVASLFGDDSIESDDLFGSSSVPKMSVSGSKSKNTKESLFDDGDDDDIFTLSLKKTKGTKNDSLFSKDEDSLLKTEKDCDDLFSKKSTGNKNQGSKPSAVQKVQSFEDPLTLFNK